MGRKKMDYAPIKKVWALNVNGDITECSAPLDKRGIGRCNHIAHQELWETGKEFLERIKHIKIPNRNFDNSFIPSEKTEIETKQYHMTDDDKLWYTCIQNRMQLDMDTSKYGGYMEMDFAIWNDMDINTLVLKISDNGPKRVSSKAIKSVLHEELSIAVNNEDDEPSFHLFANDEKMENLVASGDWTFYSGVKLNDPPKMVHRSTIPSTC